MQIYTTTIIPGQFLVENANEVVTSSGDANLILTATAGYEFSYSILERYNDGISLVDIDDADGTFFSVNINGQNIEQYDTYLGRIFWGNGNATDILTFEYENPFTLEYTVFGFVLGGDPITNIVTTANTITGFSDITTGPFAPGQPISVEDLPGASSTTSNVLNGTPGDDDLDGADDDDIIDGRGGNDEIEGEGGDDILGGRAGNDLIRGGTGNDGIEGGSGADDIRGGSGIDTATYVSSTSGVSVNLATGAASGGHANGDTLVSIENLVGSDFADALTGDDGNNVLFGERGGDVLRGGLGDDIIEGGGGGDRVLGGGGNDTATYILANGGVSLNLTSGVGTRGNANGDTFASIENVVGSGFDDVLIGSAGDNILGGSDGDDQLRGSAGDDELEGGAGADFLNGGSGVDAATYITATSGVTVNMATGGTGGDADGDTYFRVENVIGSGFDDVIRGDSAANAINAGRGDDVVRGGSGDDVITGGRGNDIMYGGGGADTFVFRANNGDDTLVAFNAAADSLRILVSGVDSLADLGVSEVGGNAVLDYGSGTITLDGISEAEVANLLFDFG